MNAGSNEPEATDVDREYVHSVNNALNTISMQVELAKEFIGSSEYDAALAILDKVLDRCRDLSSRNSG